MTDRKGLRIVFAGTPDFAECHLRALLDDGTHHVVAVYTQPDRPAGRGKKLQASPVKRLAQETGIDVQQPASLKDEAAQARLAQYAADLMVVVAYGLLLPGVVLETPRLGCINVHASLLPRWRGAAPIQRAIEAGDPQTGITIMQMDVGLDTGDMLHKVACPILPSDTAQTLHDRLADLGPSALLETLYRLQSGDSIGEKQDAGQANYANKLTKSEAHIDWQNDAQALERRIRAFNPFPMAYTFHGQERLRIVQAEPRSQAHQAQPGRILEVGDDAILVACGQGSTLALKQLQLPGKKAMRVRDILNGAATRFAVGSHLN